MDYLLFHRVAGSTGPRLAAFMGIESGIEGPEERPDFLIRYGSHAASRFRPTHLTINPRAALAGYGNRIEQLDRLSAGGVRVPFYVGRGSQLSAQSTFGVIARDFPEGRQNTQGRGITFYQAGEPTGDHDMYMSFLPKTRQYRVHVIGGRVRVRELVPEADVDTLQPVWNAGEGFTYRLPHYPVPLTVVPLAVQAVAALGLDFGAVDVIQAGFVPYVLEVNTAPGLCDATLQWYAAHLGRLIGRRADTMPGWSVVERLDSYSLEEA